MVDGKSEFYRKAEQSFIAKGYRYYDGDRDIPGKGKSHANKPDYIATKEGIVVIGEIKSPKEGPRSSSWRQVQSNDNGNFKEIRQGILMRERSGDVSPEIGGHEIIIRGQLVDYVNKIGITYDLPQSIKRTDQILMAYTFPISERNNVLQALRNCRKKTYETLDVGNGSITIIFP